MIAMGLFILAVSLDDLTWSWVVGGLSVATLIAAYGFGCWADGIQGQMNRERRRLLEKAIQDVRQGQTGYGTQKDTHPLINATLGQSIHCVVSESS